MLELRVYYHDVLRYTIIANLDKVQELRNKGFNVQVRVASGPRSGLGWWPNRLLPDDDGDDIIVRHTDGFGANKLAEVRAEAERETLGFY